MAVFLRRVARWGLWCLWLTSGIAAAAPPKAGWQRTVEVSWSGQELRKALASLAAAEQVGILLDRRIDPGQPVQWTSHGASLAETVAALARQGGATVSFVHPTCAYIGPATTVAKLRTLIHVQREEVRRLAPGIARRWQRRSDWSWPDLAEPRQLLAEEARRWGVGLPPEDVLPHDLWGAATLPAVDGVERLCLLLAQFDRTFRLVEEERVLQIVPLPATVAIEREYPLPPGDPATTLADWQQRAPESEIQIVADRLRVRATLEDHEVLNGRTGVTSADGEAAPPATPESQQRYTLRLKQVPLAELLEALAKRLPIEWVYDRERLSDAGVRWAQPMTLDVEGCTLDQLLEALVEPAGLSYQRDGRRVELLPRSAEGE